MGDIEILWPGPGLAGISFPKYRSGEPASVRDGKLTGTLKVEIEYCPRSGELPDDKIGHYLVFWVVPTGWGLTGATGVKRVLQSVGNNDPKFSDKVAEWGVSDGNQYVRTQLKLDDLKVPAQEGGWFDLVVGYAGDAESDPGAHIISVRCLSAR